MINLAVKWLPDETFYSLCCRQHAYLGNVCSSATTSWLFGTCKNYSHDFPYNLSALNTLMIETCGSPGTIICEHTIVPFFLAFQSPHNVLATYEALSGPRLGSLKYRLGLLTGRFGAEHPLKACPSCMVNDRLLYGVAYWHLSHQYPGIILCPMHGEYLRESTLNRHWSGWFEWVLPREEHLLPPLPSSTSAVDQIILKKIAEAIKDLAAYGTRRVFSPDAVRGVYRAALLAYGGLDSAACSLLAYTTRLQAYRPYGCLPSDSKMASAFLSTLIRSRETRCHPLKHLTVIAWLFDSLQHFTCLHDQLIVQELQTCDNLQGNSSEIVCTNIIFAPPNGRVKGPKRPKTIKPALRTEILLRLSNGVCKSSLCEEFHITISTVNKLLRAEPLVYDAWKLCTSGHKKFKRRLDWEKTVKLHPEESAKQIRDRISAIYGWLYRNDRQWLNNKLLELPTGRIGNHSCVDWESRDLNLMVELDAVAKLLSMNYELPLTRQLIFSTLPKVATALENRQAFRKTRALFRDLTNTGPKGTMRSAGPGVKATEKSRDMADRTRDFRHPHPDVMD
ncbi:TnsD family Tn7-like transposition protein [Pseudomonas sp. RTCS2]|uniref:TnsD family Tn7-like transposition protein n=1 Tax=Pseudomonas sp. RTCS2 TaxID=3389877 RepID=UPI0039E55887